MVQVIRFTKANTGEALWLNPEHVIYVEQADRKTASSTDTPDKKEPSGKLTIVHVSGKEGKVFIKESPEEMNKIFRSIKKEIKIEY